MRWLIIIMFFVFPAVMLPVCLYQAWSKEHPKVREPLALCIDPFASEDLGDLVYTWCKLVPMWSTKV